MLLSSQTFNFSFFQISWKVTLKTSNRSELLEWICRNGNNPKKLPILVTRDASGWSWKMRWPHSLSQFFFFSESTFTNQTSSHSIYIRTVHESLVTVGLHLSYIVEHEFFCLGHLGSSGQYGKNALEFFWDTFEGQKWSNLSLKEKVALKTNCI